MDDVKPIYDDEIDLMQIVLTLWDGKWKIIGIVIVSLLGTFGYQFTQPQSTFDATTDIKPITSVEAERYRISNAVGFFEVSPSTLLNLYIDQLEEGILFEEAIRKYDLLDVTKYEDDEAFNEAVIALASSIEILPTINYDRVADKNKWDVADGTERGDIRRYWTISFKHNDYEKWKKAISSVDSLVTQSVKSILQQRFQTSLSVARQKRDFDIEDLYLQIDNARADYLRSMKDKLAFLIEQNEIAKKLDIARSTIETQQFKMLSQVQTQHSTITNVNSDIPYYFRGYEPISKEIEFIQARTNNDAFTPGLIELEHKLRDLEQDKTLERAELLFATTPIASTNDFSAVSVMVEGTDFEAQNTPMLKLTLAVVISGMVGAMYVLFSNAIRKRKEQLGEA